MIPNCNAPRQQRKKIRVGWNPITDDDGKPAANHEALDEALTPIIDRLQDPTQAVVDAAEKCSAPSREVKKLFAESSMEIDPALRKHMSKDL